MRRISVIAAGFAALVTVMTAVPAFASNGALAHDESTNKYGLSSNEETQGKADDVAMKECGTDKCKIVFRTRSRECGAIATGDESSAWGGGKNPQRATAELAAMQNCQKHTKGQCKLRSTGCNR